MAFLCRIYEVHRYFISYQPRSGFSVYLPHSTGHPLGDATWLAAGMCTRISRHTAGVAGGTRQMARAGTRVLCVYSRSRGRWTLACRRGWWSAVDSRGSSRLNRLDFFTYGQGSTSSSVDRWGGIDSVASSEGEKEKERREGSFYAWKRERGID